MPMKKEADVKAAIKKILASLPNCWWYMPVQTGYGVRGVPDFIICLSGHFIGLETKFGGNTLSPHQQIQRDKIVRAYGDYYVVTEDTIDAMETLLREYR